MSETDNIKNEKFDTAKSANDRINQLRNEGIQAIKRKSHRGYVVEYKSETENA